MIRDFVFLVAQTLFLERIGEGFPEASMFDRIIIAHAKVVCASSLIGIVNDNLSHYYHIRSQEAQRA
jgi:hypothetical protein